MKKRSFSELRQDIVSGDWVAIATARAKRPHAFIQSRVRQWYQPKATCPFEDPQEFGNKPPVLLYPRVRPKHDWWIQVIPNKFPVFHPGVCPPEISYGPYKTMEGVGFHEVVITRDHDRTIAEFNDFETELLVRAYQERYMALQEEGCVTYISIFHNWGQAAGATIYHPHSQLIAIPVIPGDVKDSLTGSERFFKKYKQCAHCVMTKWERKEKTRVIYENEEFIAVCPFTSRTAFEIVVSPKTHSANFEIMSGESRGLFAQALRTSLLKLSKALRNPSYNFFIHTAPCKKRSDYRFYHWHVEILPKTAIWAGFEIGTGIEVNAIRPEDAASFLRKQK